MIAGVAGVPAGPIVGTLTGILVQGQVDKATEKRERKELGEQLAVGSRAAQPAGANASPQGEPVRVWVDESVSDGRLIAGHFDTPPVSDTSGI